MLKNMLESELTVQPRHNKSGQGDKGKTGKAIGYWRIQGGRGGCGQKEKSQVRTRHGCMHERVWRPKKWCGKKPKGSRKRD